LKRDVWQLVIFTTFSQNAVGLYLIWGGSKLISPFGQYDFNRISNIVILSLILIVILFATTSAIFHLGHPLRSVFSINNLRHSWLSREALSGLIFGLLVCLTILLQILEPDTFYLRNVFIILGIISGVVYVYIISRLYMLRTVPVWNHFGTPATFFSTSLLLGIIAFIAFSVINDSFGIFAFDNQVNSKNVWLLGKWIITLIGIQFLIYSISSMILFREGGKGAESVSLYWGNLRLFSICRWTFAFVGGGLIGLIRLCALNQTWLLLAFTLIFLSELIGRWLFYRVYRREGF